MNQLFIETEKIQDPREGKLQVISNIDTCNKISEFMEDTLGPFGLDKLFVEDMTITNDGATIMKKLKVTHPVGHILVKISESQDNEIGDGTTSVVVLTCAILNSLKQAIKEDFEIEQIYDTLADVKKSCIEKLDEFVVEADDDFFYSLVETSVNSKNIRGNKQLFAQIIVDAFKHANSEDLSTVGIKKIPGGSISDSILVKGIAFEKCFTYAGYEQQPKKIVNPKIACLNIELEWKAERENAELKINSIEEYKKVVDAEWNIIKAKLDACIEAGANVVLSSLPIGDYATQYFAKHNIFSAGRVSKTDLKRIIEAFGGSIVSSTDCFTGDSLASCSLFEERQMGKERYNYFEGDNSNACTILLRGPGENVLEEIERSVNDAIQVIRTAKRNSGIVSGGGSIEMALSGHVRSLSKKLEGKAIFIARAIAQAFEKVPVVLAKNFGLDPINIIGTLRKEHMEGKINMGVSRRGIINMVKEKVLEPLSLKKNLISTAFDTAMEILMIDSTLVNDKPQ
ncbi:T-complex protein 1 subunit eta [Nosema granulosis]|uniref:CCT-eta n=1 Tax=Nosema granulosis TaxID=83296 RepID=A0A9P6GZN8_9MICR|nr:T-complex protein 1 subunit eta [Nosema granulosis]